MSEQTQTGQPSPDVVLPTTTAPMPAAPAPASPAVPVAADPVAAAADALAEAMARRASSPAPSMPAAVPAQPQQPSVARIVHYFDANGKPHPAIITNVWSSSCVNLRVLPDHGGSDEFKMSVCQGTSPFNWNWPPRV